MAVILAFCIPLFIAFYPGILAWDCEYELEMVLGYVQLSTHHPPLHTFLLGMLWNIGKERGLFFLVIVQFVLYSYAVARTAETALRLGLKSLIAFAFVLFAAIFPFAISRELSLYKDALFLSLIMLLACEIAELSFDLPIRQKRNHNEMRALARITIVSFFVTTLRNDGIFIVIALMFAAAVLVKSIRRIAFGTTAICLAASLCLTTFVWPACGVVSGSKGEAFSLPIQQLSRVFSTHEEASCDNVNNAFVNVNQALDVKAAGNAYDPHFADPAKAH